MWNSLLKPLKVPSVHQIDINIFKHKFRKYLLKQQEIGDETAWSNANNQRKVFVIYHSNQCIRNTLQLRKYIL